MDKWEQALDRDLPRGGTGEEQPTAARWLNPEELRQGWSYKDATGRAAGIYLGRRDGREVGWNDDRHVLTIAGSRAGKGISLIVPNLRLYEGSVIAIDPKGELARETADHRRKNLKQKVIVLDPFHVSGDTEDAGWNPLDQLDLRSEEVVDDAMLIAEAMVQVPTRGEPHWAESAQEVVRALILCCKVLDDEKSRHLCTLHELLMLDHADIGLRGPHAMEALFDWMHTWAERLARVNADAAHVVAGVAQTYQDMEDSKERTSVFSTARTQTRFLRSPGLKRVLGKSSLRLSDLKREKMTLYLCLPAGRMASHAKWLRVVIAMALQALEGGEKPDIPVLFAMDEFNVLGTMPVISAAAGQMAGHGVRLWVVLQNLGQLKHHYEKDWETFVANSGVVTVFGNSDLETLDYISRQLGQGTIIVSGPANPSPSAMHSGSPSVSKAQVKEALLLPHELRRVLGRENMRMLVLAAGKDPVILRRADTRDPNDPLFGGKRA